MPLAQHQPVALRVVRHRRVDPQNVEVQCRQQVDHRHLAADMTGARAEHGLEVGDPNASGRIGQIVEIHGTAL